MVYEDIFDAKNACDHLSGFNVCNRYLVVLYYNANRVRMTTTASIFWSLETAGCLFFFHVFEIIWFCLFIDIAGFPEDGHKEKGGAAETPKREIRNQHRPSKVVFREPFHVFTNTPFSINM